MVSAVLATKEDELRHLQAVNRTIATHIGGWEPLLPIAEESWLSAFRRRIDFSDAGTLVGKGRPLARRLPIIHRASKGFSIGPYPFGNSSGSNNMTCMVFTHAL